MSPRLPPELQHWAIIGRFGNEYGELEAKVVRGLQLHLAGSNGAAAAEFHT